MMTEVENFVLDLLRHMRGQLDRMEHKLDDVIARPSHVERAVADHSPSSPTIQSSIVSTRITRIEKRLELVEG
ncbi:MAG: hypothetical protein ACREDD_06070 [Methylocella sp.]